MSELIESLQAVGAAAFLGGCVGLERELARRPAGLRTHVLVAIAAAALMLIGDGIAERFASDQDVARVTSDPLRVMEAVVVGISFLGAGTIVQAGGKIEGLTTAASILVTAAIGLAAATGALLFAAALTAGVVGVLVALARVERWLGTDTVDAAPARAGDADAGAARMRQG